MFLFSLIEVSVHDDVFSMSGPGRHAQIMRWCGLERILYSNPVPTSDSDQPRPRFWVPNPHSFKPHETKEHANDKIQIKRIQKLTDRHGGTNFLTNMGL